MKTIITIIALLIASTAYAKIQVTVIEKEVSEERISYRLSYGADNKTITQCRESFAADATDIREQVIAKARRIVSVNKLLTDNLPKDLTIPGYEGAVARLTGHGFDRDMVVVLVDFIPATGSTISQPIWFDLNSTIADVTLEVRQRGVRVMQAIANANTALETNIEVEE